MARRYNVADILKLFSILPRMFLHYKIINNNQIICRILYLVILKIETVFTYAKIFYVTMRQFP